MFQEFIEILILSAVQGISEFLPISSSAHLILVSNFYDLKTGSLLIDISLHLGSLFAIIFYFRNDLLDLKNNKKLLQLILLGSIPLIIFGYLLHSTELIYLLRNLKVIAWTTLFFGIVLFFADQQKIDKNISTNLNIKSIIFGITQPNGIVKRLAKVIAAEKYKEINQTGSVVDNCLIAIAT